MVVRCALLLVMFAWPVHAAEKVTRETMTSAGKTREYFLFVPESVKDRPAPLLVLLHGSGRDGKSLIDPWQRLAEREGIILASPNSADRAGWDLKQDGPYFIADLVNAVRSSHTVDPRRLYIFGHSAGAIQGLMLGLVESEYFAAVAVHAGALEQSAWSMIDLADRKIPLAIWVGTDDRLFPLSAVEATRTALEQKGIPVLLRTIKNHTHDYYKRADDVNREAWEFLKQHALTRDPRFKEYDLK